MKIIKQKGFGLLDVTLAIGIAVAVMVLNLQDKIADHEQVRARTLGVELYTYNNAVRSFISQNPAMVLPFDPDPGVGWLKTAACGGTGAVDYLPCNFPDAAEFGVVFDTLIDNDGAGFIIATTSTGAVTHRGGIRPDLSGLAALVASGGSLSNLIPIFAATEGSFTSDPETAIIIAQAANNAVLDVWLRTDGSNDMDANLSFNPANADNLREIVNLRTIRTLGVENLDIDGNVFVLGNMTADMITTNDAIDNLNNDMLLTGPGDAVIGDRAYVDDSVVIGSVDDIDTDDNAVFSEGDLGVGSDAFIDGTVTIDNVLLSKNDTNIHAVDALEVGSPIMSSFLIDRDDDTYFLDPDSTSNIFNVTANEVQADITKTIFLNEFGECSLGGGAITDCTEAALQGSPTGVIPASLEGAVDVNNLMVRKHFIQPSFGPTDYNEDPLTRSDTKWVSLQRLLPNFVHQATFLVARDGNADPETEAPQVMKPNCGPAGEPRIILTPVQMPVNVQNDLTAYPGGSSSCGFWGTNCTTDGMRYAGFTLAAQDDDENVIVGSGSTATLLFVQRWKVIMRSAPELFADGGIASSALAHTYCYYGF